MDAVIAFVMSHMELLANLGFALMGFLFAVSPKMEQNPVLNFFYSYLKKFIGPKPKA